MAPSMMPFGGGVVGPFGPSSVTPSQTTSAVDAFGLSAFGAPNSGGNPPFVSKSNTTIGGGFDLFAQPIFGGGNANVVDANVVVRFNLAEFFIDLISFWL